MILYADDIVMLHTGRGSTGIENSLNSELEQIASWFNNNNLAINLKKSKTKYVLYGTHRNILGASGFEVKLQGMKITVSTFYNYLGVIMDKSLSHKEHIEKVQKEANSRVKLLSHIRQDLTPHAAETKGGSRASSKSSRTQSEVMSHKKQSIKNSFLYQGNIMSCTFLLCVCSF